MKTLNIKNPEAYRLAEALSEATGRSLTRVVTDALRSELDRVHARKEKASVEEILALARSVFDGLPRPAVDHAALLYDEDGLPK